MSKGKQSPRERRQQPLLPTAALTDVLLQTVPRWVALEGVLPGLRRERARHRPTAHALLFQHTAAAALQTCKPAAIGEACCIQTSLEEEKREDGQGSFGPSPRISQTVTILTLGQDTAIAALLLVAARLLENASLVDFFPTTYGGKD